MTSFFVLFLFCAVFFWTCLASDIVSSYPLYSRRSILREVTDGKEVENADKPDYAVELNSTNFDEILKDTPATYAMVEFFAHWCPACRNYKPHYEKVARLFNGPDAAHPGIILMTRVDCASKINTNLCDKFSVGHYPMLFWGTPSKFVSGGWDPKKENNEVRQIDDGRTADRLLIWINKQLGSSYTLTDEKFKNDHVQTNASDPGQIARAIYDVEEATSTAFDIILSNKMIKSETRASLLKFLQLLVAHHPSRRCRKGTAEILVNFDEFYPPKMLAKELESASDLQDGLLQGTHICGKEVPRGYWMFCRGSRNDTRGYSCGLWVLLHSLSVRIDDGESQMAFSSVCDFIHNFFICEDCRRHFSDMCSRVTTPFEKARDFALWLWDAHNKVNERLMEVESSLGTGDPKYPKMIWPPKQLCPACYVGEIQKPVKWDKDEVFKFLVSYYGAGLITLYKDKKILGESRRSAAEDLATTTNAFAVPAGAAFAILAASCAFGALAWFWRSRQKNRKQRRSWRWAL